MDKPRPRDLMQVVDISKSYASVILNGAQPPSRPLAIAIYRQTGWKHDCIASLSDKQIEALAEIDPWKPMAERA